MPTNLLRKLRALFNIPERRHSHPRRRITLESLERRYALTAPVAVDDSITMPVNTPSFPTTGQVLVLNNDTDIDTLPALLKVGQVDGVNVPPLSTSDIIYELDHGTLTLKYLNGHHESFTYTPDEGFVGNETFTYRTSDETELGNEATVTITVVPLSQTVGDYTIFEGGLDSTTLAPLQLNSVAFGGSGLTYFWQIDGQAVGPTEGSESPALTVTWAELNGLNITDGNISVPVSLTVVDGSSHSATDTGVLTVINVEPEITQLDVLPGTGTDCGPVPYHLTATFSEANPLETPLQVWVDWNLDLGTELPFSEVTADAVPLTTIVPAGVNEFGFPQFTVSADHNYPAGSHIAFLWVFAAGQPFDPGAESAIMAAFIEVEEGGGTATPPTVSIVGAPETADEGTLLALMSDVDQSACGGTPTYEWTVTKDSVFVASAYTANFNYTPTDNGTYEITLVVTDLGGSATATETITVGNVAPSITSLTASQPASGGPLVVLDGAFTDPGTADSFTVVVTWESGVTQTINVPASGGTSHSFTASHTFTLIGAKPISITVTDDDLESDSDSTSASVQAALSAGGTLQVAASTTSDNVTITAPTASTVRIESNLLGGPVDFPASQVSTIQVDLGAGNDNLLVSGAVTATLLALGGPGNDIMIGGGGSNVLVGGDGIDALTGRGERDILIGGQGNDLLSGAGGQDILIDGGTPHDANLTALLAILTEWNAATTFNSRVRRLTGADPGAAYLLTGLANDAALDILLGGAANDWVISNSGDISFT